MLATVRKSLLFFSEYSLTNSYLECQVPTQRYGRRPFGVGFLMAGYDVCSSTVSYRGLKKMFLSLNRRKERIYINYVHRRIIIRANAWLLVHVLNQLEPILKRI